MGAEYCSGGVMGDGDMVPGVRKLDAGVPEQSGLGPPRA